MIDAPKLGWRRREQKQAPCLLHDADLANSSWHVRAFETSILVSNLTNSVPVRRNTCTSDCESTLLPLPPADFCRAVRRPCCPDPGASHGAAGAHCPSSGLGTRRKTGSRRCPTTHAARQQRHPAAGRATTNRDAIRSAGGCGYR